MNIAIDGPAGAGKSTIAKRTAAELRAVYVDTGAMYRAMALYMLGRGISPKDEEGVAAASAEAQISIEYRDGFQHVILNGEDVTSRLREEEVGKYASAYSANGTVRERLVELQRQIAKKVSVVMDGRDIGTVVLPDAELKIYLTASARVRALRRYRELLERGEIAKDDGRLDAIEADIIRRDEQDINREISPLQRAEDAVLIDSSGLSIDEVVAEILRLAAERAPGVTSEQRTADGESAPDCASGQRAER